MAAVCRAPPGFSYYLARFYRSQLRIGDGYAQAKARMLFIFGSPAELRPLGLPVSEP
jgi:hypothetical protein